MKSDLYITSRKKPLYYMFSLSIARYSCMSELLLFFVFFFSEFNLAEYMGVTVLGCSRAVWCLATLMDPKVFWVVNKSVKKRTLFRWWELNF